MCYNTCMGTNPDKFRCSKTFEGQRCLKDTGHKKEHMAFNFDKGEQYKWTDPRLGDYGYNSFAMVISDYVPKGLNANRND